MMGGKNASSFETIVLSRILDDPYLDEGYDYYLNWFENRFYRFKIIICILLGLYKGDPGDRSTMQAMCIEYSEWYGGWDAHYLTVGYGIFTNWFYSFDSDGDCYL